MKTAENKIAEQIDSPKANISGDIFTCFICFGPLQETVMFPCCSKYSCLLCIASWFAEPFNRNCPHCRTPLSLKQLIDAQYIDQVREHIEKIRSAMPENLVDGNKYQEEIIGDSLNNISKNLDNYMNDIQKMKLKCTKIDQTLHGIRAQKNSKERKEKQEIF